MRFVARALYFLSTLEAGSHISFFLEIVMFTTVGYGDIVPQTPPGKAFCVVYSFAAMYYYLHQMSMISMIPLELRKRRIEREVLMQVRREWHSNRDDFSYYTFN